MGNLSWPQTGDQSNVAASATSVPIVAANEGRKGVCVYNDAPSELYLSVEGAATTSNFMVRLEPYGGYWECPYRYQGPINGIWASAAGGGAARVTEIT